MSDNNASIQQLQAKLDGHQRYQAALAHYQSAQQAFSGLTISSAANQSHPLFINIGLADGTAILSSVKGFYILLTSLIVELLASVLMFARYKLITERNFTELRKPIRTRLETSRVNQRRYHHEQSGKQSVNPIGCLMNCYNKSKTTLRLAN
jgi:hypothetical protein